MVDINENAPDFCLKDQDDKNVCLEDYKGNWVVLYFYPKDNTPGCTLEARYFSLNADKFEKNNAKIIGISPDSTDSHKKFCEKNDLKITLLSDSDHEVLKNYNVWKPKKLYGREILGVVRSTFLIDPSGKVVFKWPKVKVVGHIEEIIKKMEELI